MDRVSEERDPLYVNLRDDQKSKVKSQRSDTNHHRSVQQHVHTSDISLSKKEKENIKLKRDIDSEDRKRDRGSEKRDKEKIRTTHHSRLETENNSILENNQDSNKKTPRRTEKLATPEHSKEDHRKTHIKQTYTLKASKENTNPQQKEQRTRSPQRRRVSSPAVNSMIRTENVKEYPIIANEVADITSRPRNTSKEKSSRRDSSKTRHKQDTNSLENHRKSTTNTNEIIVKEELPTVDSDKYKKSHSKKGYVINYDDKNGTVSSVCKIKAAPGSSKRKKQLKENHVKDLTKHRAPEKNALRK